MGHIEAIAEMIGRANETGVTDIAVPVDWDPRPAVVDEALRRICNLVPVFEKRGWRFHRYRSTEIQHEDSRWWRVTSEWKKIG